MAVFTEEDARTLLREEIRTARKERSRHPFAEQGPAFSGVEQRVVLVGPNFPGQVARVPIPFHSNDEKRARMYQLARVAKVARLQAVLMVSDTTMCDGERVSRFYGLTPPSKDADAYTREWLAFRREKLGDHMANLPAHLFTHAMLAVLKGPAFAHPLGVTWEYINGGRNDACFDPEAPPVRHHLMPMLENWWELPEDDPGVDDTLKSAATFLQMRGLWGWPE